MVRNGCFDLPPAHHVESTFVALDLHQIDPVIKPNLATASRPDLAKTPMICGEFCKGKCLKSEQMHPCKSVYFACKQIPFNSFKPMYIDIVPNRSSPPAVLLRESWREDGKTKKRTVANLSSLPMDVVLAIRAALKGEAVNADQAVIDPRRCLVLEGGQQHGACAAILAVIKKHGLDRLIHGRPCRERDVVLAMIVDRMLHGDSKLATARHCRPETASTSLGSILGLEDLTEKDCYAAMDWLLERQTAIEKRLAGKHFEQDQPMLYDMSSSYFEGRTCPLAKYGHSRDHRRDLPQVNYGLYCTISGVPIAIDVMPGNHSDRRAFTSAVKRVRQDLGGQSVIFVGDRGMISGAAIDAYLRDLDGADWITALTNKTVARLEHESAIQISMFDQQNLAAITHPDFPDERLIVCRNPRLAAERARKREDLLDATDRLLAKVEKKVRRQRKPIRGADAIGVEVGKVINRKKVAKHYDIDITDDDFTYRRNGERIAQEAALDGIYVIRTSVTREHMDDEDVVLHYKNLAKVERAFRSLKAMDIHIRPIHHRLEKRVRAHIFLCMLAYYVERLMRQAWAAVMFVDESNDSLDPSQREDVVQPARRSRAARKKDADKVNADGWPVVSYRDALDALGGIIRSQARFDGYDTEPFHTVSKPNAFQAHLLDLLGVAERL
jgi:transposase